LSTRQVSRTESIIVGLVIGLACPLLTFVFFWWMTAVIHMRLPRVPVQVVATAALTGLGFGVVLDMVYLKRWIKVFYTTNVLILAAVYLSLCVVAVAFCMGLPAGTFLLGTGTGVYIGRRQYHSQADIASCTATLRKTSIFAAMVTTTAAFPIGLLALDDQGVLGFLETLLGFGQADLGGLVGVTVVGVLCLVLFVVQYWCSRIAGQLAFSVGRNAAQPDPPPGAA
jgi:hypothetical protein